MLTANHILLMMAVFVSVYPILVRNKVNKDHEPVLTVVCVVVAIAIYFYEFLMHLPNIK